MRMNRKQDPRLSRDHIWNSSLKVRRQEKCREKLELEEQWDLEMAISRHFRFGMTTKLVD